MYFAAISAFIILKLMSGEECDSIVINDPVKKETIAYKCVYPTKKVVEPKLEEPKK